MQITMVDTFACSPQLTRRVLHGQSLSHGLWKRLSQSVCTISLIPENGKNSSIVAVPITNATLVQPLFYPVNFLDDQNALFDTVRLKITRKVRYVRVEAKRLEFVNLMASNAARSSHMPSSTAGVPSVPTTPSLSPKSASNYTSHAISLPSYYHLLPFGVSTSHLCLADDNPVATPPHLHTRSVTKAPRPAPPTVQVKANMMNTEKSTLDKVVSKHELSDELSNDFSPNTIRYSKDQMVEVVTTLQHQQAWPRLVPRQPTMLSVLQPHLTISTIPVHVLDMICIVLLSAVGKRGAIKVAAIVPCRHR